MSYSTITGPLPAKLSNEVSDAINKALRKGMQPDEAACVVVAVAADYARAEYGEGYLVSLAQAVLARAGDPLPSDEAKG